MASCQRCFLPQTARQWSATASVNPQTFPRHEMDGALCISFIFDKCIRINSQIFRHILWKKTWRYSWMVKLAKRQQRQSPHAREAQVIRLLPWTPVQPGLSGGTAAAARRLERYNSAPAQRHWTAPVALLTGVSHSRRSSGGSDKLLNPESART